MASEQNYENYNLKVTEISAGFAIKDYSEKTILDASYVDKISVCKMNDGYGVEIVLTENGKNIFSQYTTNNINTKSYVCIYDTAIMAPFISEPITEGVIFIPMNTYEEAEELFQTLS